jgi:hypothetical protein
VTLLPSLTEIVAEVLHADMAPGIPEIFRRVRHAEMQPGLPVTIEADVVMFDGLPGRVRIGQLDNDGQKSWWVGWLHMAGGAVSFEDGKWVRLDHDGQPMPALLKERA